MRSREVNKVPRAHELVRSGRKFFSLSLFRPRAAWRSRAVSVRVGGWVGWCARSDLRLALVRQRPPHSLTNYEIYTFTSRCCAFPSRLGQPLSFAAITHGIVQSNEEPPFTRRRVAFPSEAERCNGGCGEVESHEPRSCSQARVVDRHLRLYQPPSG